MTRYHDTDQFRGVEFADLDMSGSVFREVDMSGASLRGVMLTDADIDGDIRGLTVNGVEVAPLVEAELDRRHPERLALRASTPAGMREALRIVEEFWGATVERAQRLPAEALDRSVDGEWSFLQTLRHLVFVTDAWLGHAVLRTEAPFHRLGMTPAWLTEARSLGLDLDARPPVAEVLDARAGRFAIVRDYLATVTQEELDRELPPNLEPGWPPPGPRTPRACLRVILNEEWAHHQFAVRDLARL